MEARYEEVAEANFTFALGVSGAATSEAASRQIACCEKYGLKAIVSMAGLAPDHLPTNAECWGYFLADEPGPDAFPGLRKQVDAIRQARPGKLAFINLYPNSVPRSAIGNKTYPELVKEFVAQIQPDVLSMDHYPHFTPKSDGRQLYCDNLEIFRNESLAAGIPFWNFFNTLPYGDHLDPTEAQLRWQIFTSLAYGAKGVMYFCYWTPAGDEFPKGGAIITRKGKKTRHYEEAKRINGSVKNLGPTLLQLTNTTVVFLTPDSNYTNAMKGLPIQSITPGEYLIGVFRHADGRRAVLLNNYHFAYSSWPTVTFDVPAEKVVEVSQLTGREAPVEDDSPDMPGLQISLDAGQGRLFILP
jgi:hypothetical protein